jgi:hypothetical protein
VIDVLVRRSPRIERAALADLRQVGRKPVVLVFEFGDRGRHRHELLGSSIDVDPIAPALIHRDDERQQDPE